MLLWHNKTRIAFGAPTNEGTATSQKAGWRILRCLSTTMTTHIELVIFDLFQVC